MNQNVSHRVDLRRELKRELRREPKSTYFVNHDALERRACRRTLEGLHRGRAVPHSCEGWAIDRRHDLSEV